MSLVGDDRHENRWEVRRLPPTSDLPVPQRPTQGREGGTSNALAAALLTGEASLASLSRTQTLFPLYK